ncbi:hypothetical protein GW17_00062489, partial [Ensete ventricosum]
MQHFQISGDFHNFPQDRSMMLKDFLDDDLQSTAQDREKIEPLQFKLEIRGEVKARQPYTLMASTSFARILEERLNHK